jgi:putative ABC transport system permease protein
LVGGKLSVNRVLLLAQFAISVFCVSATWVVGNQLNYIQTKDIGFNRENLLEIFMPDRYPLEKALVLKQEISRIAGVQSASFSYYHITGVPYFNARYKVESGNEMKQVMLNELFVDEDFISTMELTIVEGRNFRNKSEFKSAFIINESAAIEFGWTNPIGKRIAVGHDKEDGGIWSEGNVVGVVKDFNTRSLHNKVEPLVMRMQYDEWPGYCLNVRYNGLERDVLAPIKEVYEKVLSGFLVEYERVNERYENQYVAENQAYATLRMATWVILLISCIGIFSMSLFISTKRKKEFGIRKVVGASIAQIAILHINYFLKVGLVANVVALPIAFYLLQQWLNGFAYKTEISSLHLVSFGVFLLVLVTLASGYSALKSGATNPVDVIKTE